MPELMSAQEILCKLNEKKCEYDFPRASERTFWEGLDEDERKSLILQAEEELEREVPVLRAAEYMKFFREGNRIDYETPFFRRRLGLAALVLGECAEYKGRFTDGIVERIWQILSEPVWCIPAHQGLRDYALPGPEEWVVDLFAAETAKVLTDVLQLLGPELEKEFLPLVKRVRYEVSRRVLEVCERQTFWWYRGSNNWSVWCCFSVNSAAIEIWQDDLPRLADFIAKHMVPMKAFFDKYPEDGGCDEGPSYWVVAVGMLLNGLEVLQRRMGGLEDWLNDPKLRRMVSFVPRLNLCGKWIMGFSDAESAFFRFSRGLFAKYGRLVNCKEMLDLAVNLPDADSSKEKFGNRNVGNIFEKMADLTEDLSPREKNPFAANDFWPDLQIWIARQMPDAPEQGMICTFKGGHNAQSHNHMDLGHFSLLHRDRPVIIDVGRGTYDRTCFSEKRFTLWNLNARGHNAARFDDMPQGLGPEFATVLQESENGIVCDLSKVFDGSCGISSYVRKLEFDREKGVIVLDENAAFEGEKSIDISFYTPVEPSDVSGSSLLLGDIRLSCEGITLVNTVPVDWADSKIDSVWGKLWQINLNCRRKDNAAWKIIFSAI